MQTNRTRSLIAISVLIATTIVGAIFSGNKIILADTVLDANYNTLTISGSGSATDPLEVDGNGMIVHCLKITGQYIDAINFVVEGCPSHAIKITGQHVTVENNVVRHSVTENGTTKCGTSSSPAGSAIKAEKGSSYVVIRGNTVYENCNEGIATTMSSNVLIEENLLWDNYSVGIYIDNSNDITVQNNWISYTGNSAYFKNNEVGNCILLGAEDYTYYGWTTNRLTNVTIDGNSLNNCKGISFWNPTRTTPVNVSIRNNIFNNVRIPYVSVSGATASANMTATPAARTATPTIAGTVTPSRTAPPTIPSTATSTRLPTSTRTSTPTPTITATKTVTPAVTPTPIFVCPLPYAFIQSSEYWLCIFKQ